MRICQSMLPTIYGQHEHFRLMLFENKCIHWCTKMIQLQYFCTCYMHSPPPNPPKNKKNIFLEKMWILWVYVFTGALGSCGSLFTITIIFFVIHRWGYLSRSGLWDKSHLTRQIEKYVYIVFPLKRLCLSCWWLDEVAFCVWIDTPTSTLLGSQIFSAQLHSCILDLMPR